MSNAKQKWFTPAGIVVIVNLMFFVCFFACLAVNKFYWKSYSPSDFISGIVVSAVLVFGFPLVDLFAMNVSVRGGCIVRYPSFDIETYKILLCYAIILNAFLWGYTVLFIKFLFNNRNKEPIDWGPLPPRK